MNVIELAEAKSKGMIIGWRISEVESIPLDPPGFLIAWRERDLAPPFEVEGLVIP